MASISLREYHNYLSNLLRQNNTDEVIAHCQHILQVYPKNVHTYRLYAQALLAAGNLQQAEQIFRRILAAYPDEFNAHYGLYQVYDRNQAGDAALWHLERAYELKPTAPDIVKQLQSAYKRHKNIELNKISLTSSAAARQYQRNGMWDKAIDTIQTAYKRYPNRVDLLLLLAQTYWDSRRPIDAAEVALQVLEVLPNCYTANRILAEMWIGQGRPADATAYLTTMEQIDPYDALSLVSGSPAADETVVLQQLDFERYAQKALVAEGADLFGELDLEGFDLEGTNASRAAVVGDSGDFFRTEIPSEWTDPEPPAKRAAVTNDTADVSPVEMASILDDIDLLADDDDPLSWMDDVDNDDALHSTTPPDDNDPLAWMEQDGSGLTGMIGGGTDTFADDSDRLAWLEQSGSGLTSMIGDSARQPALDADDPLAWMSDSGAELSTDFLAGDADEYDDETAMPNLSQASVDPMAWLADDFIDEDAVPQADDDDMSWLSIEEFGSSEAQTGPLGQVEHGTPLPEDDIPAWMADDDSMLDEMLGIEALTGGDTDLDDLFNTLPDEESSTDWLDEYHENVMADAEITVTDEDEPPAPDWLDEAVYDDSEPPIDASQLDWMAGEVVDFEQGGTDDLLAAEDTGALGWMAALDAEDTEDAHPDTNSLDWMSGLDGSDIDDELIQPPRETGSLDWLAQGDDDGTLGEDAPQEDDALEWLGNVRPGGTALFFQTDDAPADAEDDESGWMSLLDDDDDSAEMGGALGLADAALDADMPEWLMTQSADATDDGDAQGGDAMSDDLFGDLSNDIQPEDDWLSGLDDNDNLNTDDLFGEESFEEDAQPDWMSALGGEDASESDDLFGEESFEEDAQPDWMSALGDDEGESDDLFGEESFEEDAQPDWMSALGDDDASESDDLFGDESAYEEDAQPDWMSTLGDDASESDDLFGEESFEEDAQPDWMSALGDDEGESDDLFGESVAYEEEAQPDWMSAIGGDDASESDDLFGDESAYEEEAQPDWMSAIGGDVGESDDLFGDESVYEEDAQPDWMSALGGEDASESDDLFGESVAYEEEAQPDWMSAIGGDVGESDDLFGDESAYEEEAQPDWMSAIGGDDASESDDLFGDESAYEEDAQPDWMSAIGGDDASESDDLFGDESAYEEEAQPDWMSAIGGDDASESDDLFGDESAYEEEAQPDWMSALGGDDASESDDLFGESVAYEEEAQPDWMSAIGGDDTSESDDLFGESVAYEEDAQPDWMSAIGDDDASESDDLFGDESAYGEESFEEDAQSDWMAESDADDLFAEEVAYEDETTSGEWLATTEELTDDEAAYQEAEYEPSFDDALLPPEPEDEQPAEPLVPAATLAAVAAAAAAPAWLVYDPDDDLLHDDEPAPTSEPASNAPDWLNAMVPGLDFDFASGDEPIETAFVDEPTYRARTEQPQAQDDPTREFKWLVEIVQREGEGEVAQARRSPRFVFTRPPLWFRRKDAAAPPPPAADEFVRDGGTPEREPEWLERAFDGDEFIPADDFDEDK